MKENRRKPEPGSFYRHFKNKLYQVLTVAVHSETGEELVIYQALYGDYKTYARPLEMFMSQVDRTKYPNASQNNRFQRVLISPDGNVLDAEEYPAFSAEGTAADSESGREETEGAISPWLERFLDAETPEEKLAVLKQMEGHATKQDVSCMFLSMDLQPEPELPLREQIERIRRSILLRKKYDGSRLR